MSYSIKTLVLTAVVALSVPAALWAQDTTPEQETTPESEAAPVETQSGTASEIESQLSLGADADADPELGRPYTAETIGAWEMRCIKTEEETDPCQMYQLMDDGEGIPVAEFSLFRLPEGGKAVAGATIVVPLETSLPAQLKIAVDGGSARAYPYAFCNQVGCYARIGLVEQDVAAFRRGANATITIVPALAPDQTVELTLSLNGFTDSFAKASVIEQ
ncbi:invasion associated locus B family protein [Pseudosulfitobacter koreensis]|uniref:Invasion associated locus B family protein n=1 Tax=Pseudosulfitobacter koreensis TaxID=2968472 RepID=A0ABT1Z203_9RHOB|nr:invasion associated locus B family protein [Pseudosulfitobacter koreense]MCR8827164.1 invasion associated locus B family protein [Pseudosulfitobacter koreense]